MLQKIEAPLPETNVDGLLLELVKLILNRNAELNARELAVESVSDILMRDELECYRLLKGEEVVGSDILTLTGPQGDEIKSAPTNCILSMRYRAFGTKLNVVARSLPSKAKERTPEYRLRIKLQAVRKRLANYVKGDDFPNLQAL